MPHDKPEFIEFPIHNDRLLNNRVPTPSPYGGVKWGIPEVPTEIEKQSSIADLDKLLANTYQDMLTNMLRNDSIISARMKGYKRDRTYGRRKWSFRVHSKAGRLLEKLGYWHLIDYVAFMWGIAKEAWALEDYEFHRLSED